MEKIESAALQNIVALTRDKRNREEKRKEKLEQKIIEELDRKKNMKKTVSKRIEERKVETNKYLEFDRQYQKEMERAGGLIHPPPIKRVLPKVNKNNREPVEQPTFKLSEKEQAILDNEKKKKAEAIEKLQREFELKKEIRERVLISELAPTKNYKAMGNAKDVHAYIEAHGLLQYSKQMRENQENSRGISIIQSKSAKINNFNEEDESKIQNHKTKLNTKMSHNLFNNATTLIKPEIDASDKQILERNNFLTAGNKVKLMLVSEGNIYFDDFKPKRRGELSGNVNFVHSKSPNKIVDPIKEVDEEKLNETELKGIKIDKPNRADLAQRTETVESEISKPPLHK